MERSTFSEKTRTFVREWAVTIGVYLFVTTTLLQAFVVPTPSMDTTVMVGDHLLVDKLTYAPFGKLGAHFLPHADVKRGDIIVFRYPLAPSETYVKRCVGVPGDHIRLDGKQLFINGHKAEEPYARHIDPGVDAYRDNFPPHEAQVYWPTVQARDMVRDHARDGEIVVPQGYYFALGDNRDNSADSRYWGFVPRENIIGRPLLIYWSYDAPTEHLLSFIPGADHLLDLAQHFFSKTRWKRTFQLVRAYPLK